MSEIHKSDNKPDVPPEVVWTSVEDRPERLLLQRRLGNGCLAFFMTLWLVPWTTGGVVFAAEAIQGADPQSWLSAIGMLAVSVAVTVVVAWHFLGKESLEVGPFGVTRQWSVMVPLSKSRVSLNEVSEVDLVVGRVREGHEEFVIQITAGEKTLRYGLGLKRRELRCLLSMIHERLEHPGRTPPATVPQAIPLKTVVPSRRREPKQAPSVEDLPGGFIVSWFVGLGWCIVAVIWNLSSISLIVHLFNNFSWLNLVFIVPFVIIGLIPALVLWAAVSVTIDSLKRWFKRR